MDDRAHPKVIRVLAEELGAEIDDQVNRLIRLAQGGPGEEGHHREMLVGMIPVFSCGATGNTGVSC